MKIRYGRIADIRYRLLPVQELGSEERQEDNDGDQQHVHRVVDRLLIQKGSNIYKL